MEQVYRILAVSIIGIAVNGITIDPPKLVSRGKLFAVSTVPDVTLNDPRCQVNGLFANPDDCTKYYVCNEGTSQDRPCPEGFKFDSVKHCTPDPKADCGKQATEEFSSVLNSIVCPEEDMKFAFPGNCRIYVQCQNGRVQFHHCPLHQVYQIGSGCVPGEECPPNTQQGEPSICENGDGLYPVPSECHKYIKCVDGEAKHKQCPLDQGFDRKTKSCKNLQNARCRSNEIHEIMMQ